MDYIIYSKLNDGLEDKIDDMNSLFELYYSNYLTSEYQYLLPYLLKVLTNKEFFLYEQDDSKRTEFYRAFLDLKSEYTENRFLESAYKILEKEEHTDSEEKLILSIVSVFFRDFQDIYRQEFNTITGQLKQYIKKAIDIRDNMPVYNMQKNKNDYTLYEIYKELQTLKQSLPRTDVPISKYQVNFQKIKDDAKTSGNDEFKDIARTIHSTQKEVLRQATTQQVEHITSLLKHISIGNCFLIKDEATSIQQIAIAILNASNILLDEQIVKNGTKDKKIPPGKYTSGMLILNFTLLEALVLRTRLIEKKYAGKIPKLPQDILEYIQDML